MTFWRGMIAGVPGNRHLRKAIVGYDWYLDDPDFGENEELEPDLDTLGTMVITFTQADGVYEYPSITWGEYLDHKENGTRPL